MTTTMTANANGDRESEGRKVLIRKLIVAGSSWVANGVDDRIKRSWGFIEGGERKGATHTVHDICAGGGHSSQHCIAVT